MGLDRTIVNLYTATMINKTPEAKAVEMIEEFVSAMCRLSYKHGREWLVIDRDNDQVTFTLDI